MRPIRLLKRDLATEAGTWVRQEIVSARQARAICQLYGVDLDATGRRSSGYRTLIVLGFLFIGLALITLIGANWNEIPRGVRMGGLLVLTAGTHALAIREHLWGRTSRTARVLFLGNLFYGTSIVLIAQIYHLGEHLPDGVFWWAMGTLPFAVLLRDPWLALFSALLALIWMYLEFKTGFLDATFFCIAFPAFLAAELYVLAQGRRSISLLLIFALSAFLWFQAVLATAWSDRTPVWSAEHVLTSVALLILAHAAGQWLMATDSDKAKDYGTALSLWTLCLAVLGMFVLSFEWSWAEIIRADWNHRTSMWIVLAALAGTALWIAPKRATLALPILVVAGAAITVTHESAGRSWAIGFQVLDNAALVAIGIGLIVRGAGAGSSQHSFLGIATILLTGLIRYLDLVGDYIGGAVLFLAFAALLLGAATYWKSRPGREGEP